MGGGAASRAPSAGDGRGKVSNKGIPKQISAWYCGIALRICTKKVDRRVEAPGMEQFGNA